MAIKGSLREASLPDVLQLLSMGKKTGCLSIAHKSNFGYIYFDKGRISYASIVNRRDRLGDILVKNGDITQAQLDAAIQSQETHRNARIGDLLVAQGAITRDLLHEQLRSQIEEAVYFLFTWSEGSFNFEPDVNPDEQDVTVSINPESLLLEGARRVDEWSLIEKKISSFDLIFERDGARIADSEVELEADQRRILELVDGQRDVAQIVEDSGLAEFDVGKALYGLATAGFIHRVGKSKRAEPAVAEARVEEHRNLGIAFYKAGMLEEATREFRRVAELRDDDASARFYLGLVLLKQARWGDAARVFQEAAGMHAARPAIFHNLAYAYERDGRFDDARAALEEASRRGGAKDARIQTSLGAVALRAGDAAAADAALQAARPLWGARPPSAAWYHYAALAAALVGDLDRAEALARDGIAAYPRIAVLHNDLGVLLERRGDADGALAALEAGIAEDSGLAQLHKNVGDLHYRAARYDAAFAAYQRAVKADGELGDDVWLKLGNIRFRRQERDEAVRCWERALEIDPTNAIVRTNLDAVRQAT
jgi:tetratricopeptide (TPR) repeat protein